MTDASNINHIHFVADVELGGVPHSAWHRAAPGSTALAGKVTPRYSDVARGDRWPDSIVFECRQPRDFYDVEVPASNIRSVIHAVDMAPASAPAPAAPPQDPPPASPPPAKPPLATTTASPNPKK